MNGFIVFIMSVTMSAFAGLKDANMISLTVIRVAKTSLL